MKLGGVVTRSMEASRDWVERVGRSVEFEFRECPLARQSRSKLEFRKARFSWIVSSCTGVKTLKEGGL